MSTIGRATEAWLATLSDEEFEAQMDRERDDRFLEFAKTVQIGAEAIREKRRLQERLAAVEADRDKWMKLCMDGDAARNSILGDLVVGLTSGVLRVDRDVPLPDRFKALLPDLA